MKLIPLHPFSRRYLLPGQSAKNNLSRLIISLDVWLNIRSLTGHFDGVDCNGVPPLPPPAASGIAVIDLLGKRQSLASLAKEIEDNPDWSDEKTLGDSGFGKDDDACVVRDQPDGKLLDPENFEEQRKEEPENMQENPSEKPADEIPGGHKCSGWRMEKLAWYSSAHTNEIRNYGIHITKNGAAKILKKIEKLIIGQGKPAQDRKILIFSVLFKFYAHEFCHAWVEDLCSLIDFIHEENRDRKDRRYSTTLDRFNAYIFLEEALCNTAAYGLLYTQLNKIKEIRDAKMVVIPDFDPDVILSAFADWMKSQPKGYRDYSAIKEEPQSNDLFTANLQRLLSHAKLFDYKQDKLLLEDIITGFFSRPRDGSIEITNWVTGSRFAPPVFLELAGQ